MGSLRTGVLALALVWVAPSASAGPDLSGYDPPPDLVGLTPVVTIAPDEGLVDTIVTDDGAGTLAYVLTDAADHAEVHLLDVATNTELRMFDISSFTARPETLTFAGKGKSAAMLVTFRNDDQLVMGALYDAKGTKLKGYGPAVAVTVVPSAKGKPQIMVRKVSVGKNGAETHTAQLYAPTKKAKKIGKAKKLVLTDGYSAKLGFRLNHWSRDFTVAVGLKDGEWSKKEDSRGPDLDARFDLLTGKMATSAMGDLRAHKVRFEMMAADCAVLDKPCKPAVFVRVATDQTGVEVWRNEQLSAITLDQGFDLYDPKSLAYGLDDDGTVWLGLRVDPWNRPALARKRADTEYFDVFHVDATGAATRKGRLLAPKGQFAVGAVAGKVWLIERSVGFDRGGSSLVVYQ